MKPLQYFAIFAFASGLVMVGVGYFYGGENAGNPAAKPGIVFDRSRVAIISPAVVPDDAPSPTLAPPPFDGSVGRLKLVRLGINNAIEEIGLIPNTNELDTPHDAIEKVGWYRIYDKPGFNGNAIFSAHVNYDFKQGPFAKLKDVQPDDEIVIEMVGGPTYRYRVFRKQLYAVDTIPMGDIISPKDRPANEEWITLITCGGRFVPTQANGLGHYEGRDVVVALRVQ